MDSVPDKQARNDAARLRAVLDTAADGVITIDVRGIIEEVNPAAEKLFGYTSRDMIGQNVNMLMPSPYSEEHDGYLANYDRTGERKIIGIGREVEGRRKDGSTFPLYLAVSEATFEGRRIFTGFVHDLTDVKQAQQRATQLGRILENSVNEIFIFDAQTMKFLFINRGAMENIGYTTSEMSERTPADIKPQFTMQEFEAHIAPLRSGLVDVLQFETVHERKDSSRYNVVVKLQTAEWEGRPAFVAIILDITDRKRAEDDLAELNAELEERVEQRTRELGDAQAQLVRREKLAALGQLSGGVAHEIRNPLGVIKNSVYYMKMNTNQLDEDMTECVADIEREVETANRIVSELLDFTRDPPAHAEEFSMEDCITTALQSARVPSQVAVSVPDVPRQLRVRADRGQIERVLTNLIRNAWQAMDGVGSLTVTVATSGQLAVVDVKDSGVGIPENDISRIFEPLFTTKAKGIGLGLAVSRRYAQRNGGSLTVESTQGVGTTFHLAVPLAETKSK